MYQQIDGKWPEPTTKDFPPTTKQYVYTYKGIFFEDIHYWWRHLPENEKYIPNIS